MVVQLLFAHLFIHSCILSKQIYSAKSYIYIYKPVLKNDYILCPYACTFLNSRAHTNKRGQPHPVKRKELVRQSLVNSESNFTIMLKILLKLSTVTYEIFMLLTKTDRFYKRSAIFLGHIVYIVLKLNYSLII